MIEFATERMQDAVDALRPLHRAHWEESRHLRPPGEFNPDYERFYRLQDAGQAFLVTARRMGVMVGYVNVYSDSEPITRAPFAVIDTFYVLPAERNGWMAVKLFEYAHAMLKHIGITDVRAWMPEDEPLTALMRYAGYALTPTRLYTRHL